MGHEGLMIIMGVCHVRDAQAQGPSVSLAVGRRASAQPKKRLTVAHCQSVLPSKGTRWTIGNTECNVVAGG